MDAADQGPWQKPDPVKLYREAEAKEAKLKRQQEQRLVRAAARKEKRHAKSEAKQARKANVGRAAKWTPERRALDKQKKLANRPHKDEKRRRRMRLRAEKLEVQAKKLWEEAQRARARADYMDDKKAQEEGFKNQLGDEEKVKAEDPTNDDYIALDTPDEPGVTPVKKEKKKEAKLLDRALDTIMEQEIGPSITASGLHVQAEEEKRKKRKEEKQAEKLAKKLREAAEQGRVPDIHEESKDVDIAGQAATSETIPSQDSAAKVNGVHEDSQDLETSKKTRDKKKKRKSSTEISETFEEPDEIVASPDKKEKKKKRKSSAEINGASEGADDVARSPDKKQKKKKRRLGSLAIEATEEVDTATTPSDYKEEKRKKRKQESSPELNGDNNEVDHLDEPKVKKSKKKDKKKDKQQAPDSEKYVSTTPAVTSEPEADSGGQWNVSALEGDEKRKEKFLKLLGGKKVDATAATNHAKSSSSKDRIAHIQSDLERQFETGIRMKNEGHGHRRGLGA